MKTYSELITIPTFDERMEYLKLGTGGIGAETFGSDRIFYEQFLWSNEWKKFRREIIMRDNFCDLGVDGYEIPRGAQIHIHHINPVRIEDLNDVRRLLMNPDNVITTVHETHMYIHYGSNRPRHRELFVERKPFDTCPWRD